MPTETKETPANIRELPSRIGRNAEWETLQEWLDETANGNGGLAVLSGPAGSGKTFLSDHLEEWALANGFQTGRGRFEPGPRSRIPWPWPAILRGLGGDEAGGLARELVLTGLDGAPSMPDGFLSSSGLEAGRLVN